MENPMPWGWVLENLLDVKELSLSFFKDIIENIQPHLEQPQCSRLLQKVALRYLDEEEEEEEEEEVTASPRRFDVCDIVLLRFLLKEQGVSNLDTRIHSLKESCGNNLALRVETEAVLTNLRCNGNHGGGDWAAFEDALDSVFSEGMVAPRDAERRKELTAVLQDRSRAEPEKQLCNELLGKFPLEELCRDLASFVEDKRKFFKIDKINFLDQVAKDVENSVCSFAPGSDSPEPRDGTTLPGSTPLSSENDMHIEIQQGRDSDTRNRVTAGAPVSEIKEMRTELSLNMAELHEVGKEFRKEGLGFVNHLANFKEDVHHTASMPVLSPDLGNQQVCSLAAPIAGNLLSMQQNCFVICPAKRDEVHLETDEQVEDQGKNIISADWSRNEAFKRCTERDMQQTSPISSEKVTKRSANEVIDHVTAMTKKRKFNNVEELSKEQRNQSGATEENEGFPFRPMIQNTFGEEPSNDRISSEVMCIAGIRVLENCNMIDRQVQKNPSSKHGLTLGESYLPIADGEDGELNANCYFCGSSGGRQAFCHQCSVSIHEGCLSKVCSSQEGEQNCWYCFGCAATMAHEGLRRAQEGVREAIEKRRKAEEAVVTTKERFATFLSARKECSREPLEGQNAVEFSQGTPCGTVGGATHQNIKLVHAGQVTTEDSRPDPQVEDMTVSSKSEIVPETRVHLSEWILQNVMEQDTIRESCRTAQDTEMPTAPQAAILSEGLNAVIGNDRPGQELPREIVCGPGSTSVNSVPVSQGRPPGEKHVLGYCGQEQSEGRRSLAHIKAPMISDPKDSRTKSGPDSMLNEDVGETNVATDGSEAPVDHGGHSSPPRDLLLNTRNPEADGDGHDGDLEESCEGNRAAIYRINVAEQAAVISENISTKVGEKLRPRKVYRARGQVPGVRRRNLPWTEIEEDVLKEGVCMFSNGGEFGFQWKRILEFGVGKFNEGRTAVDLKDKWRNMRSKQG